MTGATCQVPGGTRPQMSLCTSAARIADLRSPIRWSTSLHSGTFRRRILWAVVCRYTAPTISEGYGLEGQQFETRQERQIFLQCPDQLWSPLSFIFSGSRGSFPGADRPKREVYHSSPSKAVNKWRYTYTPVICLPNLFLRDTGPDTLKTHKPEAVPGKSGQNRSIFIWYRWWRKHISQRCR
jgi:hypothetical protein